MRGWRGVLNCCGSQRWAWFDQFLRPGRRSSPFMPWAAGVRIIRAEKASIVRRSIDIDYRITSFSRSARGREQRRAQCRYCRMSARSARGSALITRPLQARSPSPADAVFPVAAGLQSSSLARLVCANTCASRQLAASGRSGYRRSHRRWSRKPPDRPDGMPLVARRILSTPCWRSSGGIGGGSFLLGGRPSGDAQAGSQSRARNSLHCKQEPRYI